MAYNRLNIVYTHKVIYFLLLFIKRRKKNLFYCLKNILRPLPTSHAHTPHVLTSQQSQRGWNGKHKKLIIKCLNKGDGKKKPSRRWLHRDAGAHESRRMKEWRRKNGLKNFREHGKNDNGLMIEWLKVSECQCTRSSGNFNGAGSLISLTLSRLLECYFYAGYGLCLPARTIRSIRFSFAFGHDQSRQLNKGKVFCCCCYCCFWNKNLDSN